jgi:hypothetical protein
MGIISAPIALLLFTFIGVIQSILTPFKYLYRRAFFRKWHNTSFSFAYDVDVVGNYLFRDTWNLLFCKKGVNEFGRFGETISSVLGRIRKQGGSHFGLIFGYFLDVIWITDWLKGGHCRASIMTSTEIKINKLKYK